VLSGWFVVYHTKYAHGFLTLQAISSPSYNLYSHHVRIRSRQCQKLLISGDDVASITDQDSDMQTQTPPIQVQPLTPPPPQRRTEPLGVQAINSLLVQSTDDVECLLEIVDDNLKGFNDVNCATALDRYDHV